MKRVWRNLSKGIPFSNIDLYEVNGRVFFGESTFYIAVEYGESRPPPLLSKKECNNCLGDFIILRGEQGQRINEEGLVIYDCFDAKRRVDLRDFKFFCLNGKVKLWTTIE